MFRALSKTMDISKALENINFEYLANKNLGIEYDEEHDKVVNDIKCSSKPEKQLTNFQISMKWLFFIGKCIGLSPMIGTWDTNNTNMRFFIFIQKFLYAITLGVLQAIGIILSIIFFKFSISVRTIGNCVFYLTTSSSTFLYIYVASRKLPRLLKQLSTLSVNGYRDPSVKYKCYTICLLTTISATFEHILFFVAKLRSLGYMDGEADFNYEDFLRKTYAWYYDLGFGGGKVVGIVIQVVNVINTLNWNYSDMFIICISFYLVSLLNHVNKKIVLASEQHYLSPGHWRALREEYNLITRLVHSFNDVISGIVLISFANSIFFICHQFYNILLSLKAQAKHSGNNYNVDMVYENQSNSAYECAVYHIFSAVYLLVRSLVVSLVAASVHTASLVPATALYNVPSSGFSQEVKRLLTQVHTDTVAINGLQFFYVTRELVLSLVGTILTYELVLIQFGAEENHTKLDYC